MRLLFVAELFTVDPRVECMKTEDIVSTTNTMRANGSNVESYRTAVAIVGLLRVENMAFLWVLELARSSMGWQDHGNRCAFAHFALNFNESTIMLNEAITY